MLCYIFYFYNHVLLYSARGQRLRNCLPVGIHSNLIRGAWPRIKQSQFSFCWVKIKVYNNMNYQNGGLSHLPEPKAEADKTNMRFGNSWDFSKMFNNGNDNVNGPLTQLKFIGPIRTNCKEAKESDQLAFYSAQPRNWTLSFLLFLLFSKLCTVLVSTNWV